MYLIFILSVLCFTTGISGSFGPFQQDYGYEEVRPGAHMFWWLFFTTADVDHYTERPLVVWLQGGPGGSSTGYGNFEMIGPMDLSLQERNTSWVKNFNLMFIDNPVGTGYSYVTNETLLTTDNEQIGTDLVTMMGGFYEKHPEFRTVPFYIFGQSYGGKMAVDFALQLYSANAAGSVQSNLRGMAMGNAWISPMEIVMTWAPFLRTVGLVDQEGYDEIMVAAQLTETLLNQGLYINATNQWRNTQSVIIRRTDGVDFYNILTKNRRDPNNTRIDEGQFVDPLGYNTDVLDIDKLMNTEVKSALGIPEHVVWVLSSDTVFNVLNVDFMKPVVDGVERLLNETDITVMVYNGNLDLICDTPGQIEWVKRLQWEGAQGYIQSPRLPVWENDVLEGYVKSYGNFRFYWVNYAGHSAPLDNPGAADYFLRDMTSFG